MKQFIFYLVIAGIIFFCSCRNQSEALATDFYRNFNLGEIVEKINAPQLQSSGGGGGSTTSSGETTEQRRHFSITYHLKEQDSERFDEKKFLNELKFEIENKMNEAGIRVNSKGSGDSIFYFTYSKDQNEGWLEVVGARLEGNKYKLWCVMREDAKAKDN